jgi:predicted membrane channel-forming protein YqfA (hemolysin III family)
MKWLDLQSLGGPITDIDEYMNYVSRWPLFAHMLSAIICLGLSTLFHSFFVYS